MRSGGRQLGAHGGVTSALVLALALVLAGDPVQSASDPFGATFCARIGAKLDSVSAHECLRAGLAPSDGRSALGQPIAVAELTPASSDARRVLLIGGTHADEYSSVSVIFKWLQLPRRQDLHWRIVPVLNPDGLLREGSTRVNGRGVDLNRNLPTPGWQQATHYYWHNRTGRDPRRYPGPAAASEPETRWLIAEIERFGPDAIVAVHARYGNFLYDGPGRAPAGLGSLRRGRLADYPGTLGAYAGDTLGIPVLTLELPHAGILPPPRETQRIWSDLQAWLAAGAS